MNVIVRCGFGILVAAALSGCGTSNSTSVGSAGAGGGGPIPLAGVGASGLSLVTTLKVPGIVAGATSTFVYDFSAIDPVLHNYYLTDRTNKALDIINTQTSQVSQVTGFTGVVNDPTGIANPDLSGPNAAIPITGTNLVAVTDVGRVAIVDVVAKAVLQNIVTSTGVHRTDAGCYDPVDKILMVQNSGDTPPFSTFISAVPPYAIIATLAFPDSVGLESCVYDPTTKNFFLNNDGSLTVPARKYGELYAIPAAGVVAGAPAVTTKFGLGACGPGGLALGPNDQIGIACDPPPGYPEITLLVDATTGAIVRTAPIGGTDQIAYDPFTKRFYTASRNMTSTGIAGSGSKTPVLGVIDAATFNLVQQIPTAAGTHAVSVDPTNGHVYLPVIPTATFSGGINVYAPAGTF